MFTKNKPQYTVRAIRPHYDTPEEEQAAIDKAAQRLYDCFAALGLLEDPPQDKLNL